jgi:hypothetical protein
MIVPYFSIRISVWFTIRINMGLRRKCTLHTRIVSHINRWFYYIQKQRWILKVAFVYRWCIVWMPVRYYLHEEPQHLHHAPSTERTVTNNNNKKKTQQRKGDMYSFFLCSFLACCIVLYIYSP